MPTASARSPWMSVRSPRPPCSSAPDLPRPRRPGRADALLVPTHEGTTAAPTDGNSRRGVAPPGSATALPPSGEPTPYAGADAVAEERGELAGRDLLDRSLRGQRGGGGP